MSSESVLAAEAPETGSPLPRLSIAEQVADVLRQRIADGYYRPGSRLSEQAICLELKISRNTLREAFRLLTHERLLRHEPYRGVSVREVRVDDIEDLYRVRKVIECGAVTIGTVNADRLARIRAAVKAGETAERDADWQALGTANIRFHQALVALAGSHGLDDMMRGVLAELRLVFHVMDDPRRFHEPYLDRNREIADRLADDDRAAAVAMLATYLDDAERQLVTAFTSIGTR